MAKIITAHSTEDKFTMNPKYMANNAKNI